MKVVVAGGTGLIGTALIEALLARGDEAVLVTREPEHAVRRWEGRLAVRGWDGRNPGPWVSTLAGADAVVNLCGAGVADARWSPARKLALIKSRIEPTRALLIGLTQSERRPKAFISASAVGYYGADPSGECPEDASQGTDFLASLCGQWEREALAAEKLGVRVTLARFGVVLSPKGGALKRMLPPFKLGLGGRLGTGRQPFPWVHAADAVGALLFLAQTPVPGPVNIVAPEAHSNAGFTKALGRALHRPAILPAPAFALRLILGEMSTMLLQGQRAQPHRLQAAGYLFQQPELAEALKDLVA